MVARLFEGYGHVWVAKSKFVAERGQLSLKRVFVRSQSPQDVTELRVALHHSLDNCGQPATQKSVPRAEPLQSLARTAAQQREHRPKNGLRRNNTKKFIDWPDLSQIRKLRWPSNVSHRW